MTTCTIVAHASDSKVLATKGAWRLAKLGLEVECVAIERIPDVARRADRLIVLWSRNAACAEATLRHPHVVEEKLCIARLASGPPPPQLRAAIVSWPRSRSDDQAWRALVSAAKASPDKGKRREVRVSEYRSARWEGLLAALLMAIVIGSATYVSSPELPTRWTPQSRASAVSAGGPTIAPPAGSHLHRAADREGHDFVEPADIGLMITQIKLEPVLGERGAQIPRVVVDAGVNVLGAIRA